MDWIYIINGETGTFGGKFHFYCVARIYNIMYIRENQLLFGLKICEGSIFQRRMCANCGQMSL